MNVSKIIVMCENAKDNQSGTWVTFDLNKRGHTTSHKMARPGT